jgi:hypothetical protein
MPTDIPAKVEFQLATNLKIAVTDKRDTDVILQRIDSLLDAYALCGRLQRLTGRLHAFGVGGTTCEEQEKMMVLGKLYYATNAWLKQADRGGSGVNPRRKDAVYDLFVKVVNRLSEDTKVTVNVLPRWLTETFGKSMHEHGVEVDLTSNCAEYLTAKAVGKFRLEFRGGLAYQQQWWRNSPKLVMAASGNVREGTKDLQAKQGRPGDEIKAGFSGYVMSMGGDIYTGPHFTAEINSRHGRYHSSYFAGEPVLSAGEIKIEQGWVRAINNESGHYRPGPEKLMMAVEVLACLGVNMAELKVEARGQGEVSGREFLRARWGRQAVAANRSQDVAATPLALHQVKATLNAHNNATEMQTAFTLFKKHWQPKAKGGHAPHGKDKCQACKGFRIHWPAFESAIDEYRGIDLVPIRVILPANARRELVVRDGVNRTPWVS